MRLRVFCPAGLCVAFLGVATLVFGGLGWVTVASLGVEQAQREAAARADRSGLERIALWRLDGHLLPAIGVENNRPFAHYTALHTPISAVDAGQNTLAAGSLRLPSPLLSADIPAWMLLHFQIDPDAGWISPQVIPDTLAGQLQAPPFELALTNVTSERRALLADLGARFPAADALRVLTERDQAAPDTSPFVVPVPLTDETAVPKPAGSPSGDEPARPRPAPKSLWLVQQVANAERASERHEIVRVQPTEAGTARQLTGVPPDGDTPTARAAQPPSYAFNRAVPNSTSVAPPMSDKPVEQVNRPEYAARLKATQQNLDQRGSYQNTTQARNNLQFAPGSAEAMRSLAPIPPATATLTEKANGPGLPVTPYAAAKQAGESPIPHFDVMRPQSGGSAGNPTTNPGFASRMGRPATGVGGIPGFDATPGAGGPPGGAAGLSSNTPPLPQKPQSPLPTPVPGTLRAAGTAVANTTPAAAEHQHLSREQKHQERDGTTPGARKSPPEVQPVTVHLGPLRPLWLTAADDTDVLVLVRTARLEHKTVYQGVLLDWPRVREVLVAQVSDLFAAATLTPAHAADAVMRERVMTALPVQLDPGPAPELPPTGVTPLRVGLVLAWAAAVVALAAVGVGGRALVDLSERRIRFVSAVTHELRTPLTSLRLYLDLLTSGMIADEAKQKEYLHTLAGESERLNRLIENVLDFAKLEKRSVQAVMQPTSVDGLLTEIRHTWADRCAADGMELVAVSTLPPGEDVVTDSRMAAQILGNLVDNARKYARGAVDPRVWVWAKPGVRGRVVFEVEDRGPGVPTAERGSVFRPFRRGHAADTIAGGAGLGLALAKHWADLLGGRLSYRPADGGIGACFRLELPARA